MDRSDALSASLAVFVQYGYRKTSMEDVARAVGVSRQWIYQQFESKEKLFADVVSHALAMSRDGAIAALADDGALADRMLRAFDRWCGDAMDSIGASPHSEELFDAAVSRHGDQIVAMETDFQRALEHALEHGSTRHAATISHADIALTLLRASHGIKKTAADRAAYLDEMRRVVLVTIGERPSYSPT
ncbi:MAG: helix-turn-helix domain-containing protein [Planctomycetota bacterium]